MPSTGMPPWCAHMPKLVCSHAVQTVAGQQRRLMGPWVLCVRIEVTSSVASRIQQNDEQQRAASGWACIKLTAVGFEPTQLALVELESTPLDHSGKLSLGPLAFAFSSALSDEAKSEQLVPHPT